MEVIATIFMVFGGMCLGFALYEIILKNQIKHGKLPKSLKELGIQLPKGGDVCVAPGSEPGGELKAKE